MKLITTARLALFHAIISERLHCDRNAVKRDVDESARAGLVTVSEKVLPGHGRMKEVRADSAAQRISLMAEVA